MKKVIFTTLSLAVLATFSSTANAGPNDNCHGYSMQAVSQYKQALANKCGIGGLGWTTDYNMHRTWCQLPTTSTGELNHWSNKRKAAVHGCLQAISKLNNNGKKPQGGIPWGSKCHQGKKEVKNAGFKNVKIWKNKGLYCQFTGRRQGQKYIVVTTQNSANGAKIVNFKTY